MAFGLSARLGPLEAKLLRLLWRRGSGTVRELHESGQFEVAYTTLMTTLDRLHKKGLLSRSADGRAFRYAPLQTEDEFNGTILRKTISQMLGRAESSIAPLSFLVEAVSEYDRALLDDLEREIERKRRELEKEDRK